MANLYYASLALKVGMLIDLHHRGAPFWWAFVILLLPGGELAYLAVVLIPDLLPMRRRVPKARRVPLDRLRWALRENPCHANRLALADRLREDGDLDGARALYGELLAAEPDDRNALWGLGLVQRAAGEHEDAVGVLGRLVELRRSFADYAAWLCLAETLSESGRHEEALEAFEALVRTAPRIAHQLALAEGQRAAGRREDAARTLEAALEDHRHAPRFVRREAREPARRATRLLDELRAAV